MLLTTMYTALNANLTGLTNGVNRALTANQTTLRSGENGTEKRAALLNGTQSNPQTLSSFVKEDREDDEDGLIKRCNKKTLGSGEPTASYTKSFWA